MEVLNFNQITDILNFDGILTINKVILWADTDEQKQKATEWVKQNYPKKPLIEMNDKFNRSFQENPRGFICVSTKVDGSKHLKNMIEAGYMMNHCIHILVGSELL